jgi:hypothetical protein
VATGLQSNLRAEQAIEAKTMQSARDTSSSSALAAKISQLRRMGLPRIDVAISHTSLVNEANSNSNEEKAHCGAIVNRHMEKPLSIYFKAMKCRTATAVIK